MNKLNKKGASLGLIVLTFVGIIVALALFVPIINTTGDMTTIRTATLDNYTTSATVNGAVTLDGRENTTAIMVVNASDTGDDWSANFSVNTTNTAGALAILLVTSADAVTAEQNGSLASVTYSYKPSGYSDNAGSRGIVGIILIFAALTIMAFAYGPVREALADMGIGN